MIVWPFFVAFLVLLIISALFLKFIKEKYSYNPVFNRDHDEIAKIFKSLMIKSLLLLFLTLIVCIIGLVLMILKKNTVLLGAHSFFMLFLLLAFCYWFLMYNYPPEI
jgi:hypothetical protein